MSGMTRKGERTSGGNLPSGPYMMEVVRTRPRRFETSGSSGHELLLKLVGTDLHIHWYLVDKPGARWTWCDWLTDLSDVPNSVGRRFIVYIGKNDYQGRTRNQVKQVMAEVLP